MNFFGHAAVACWHRTAPKYVLGAMLPDFASMSRTRVADVEDDEVAAGVSLHHRTDAAFHRAASFRRLYRRGIDALLARGLARGPALGAAHVGIELLLDGTLVDDAAVGAAYLSAISIAGRVPIRWRDDRGAARWREIHGHLSNRGIPVEYRDPDQVRERVALVLSSRPRLRLSERDLPAVGGWLRDTAPEVEKAAIPLLEEVRAALFAT